MIWAMLAFIAIKYAIIMVMYEEPYMSSLEQIINHDDLGIRPMSEMNKVMIDLSSGNFDDTIIYDDVKDYIFIGIRNVVRKYTPNPEGGVGADKILNETTNHFDVVRCDESNYDTDYEKEYFEITKDLNASCFDKQD